MVYIEKGIFRSFLVNLVLQFTSAVLRAYRGLPAQIHNYTLLVYSPFRGSAGREVFLLGYETPMKWTLFRKQQHVEGEGAKIHAIVIAIRYAS